MQNNIPLVERFKYSLANFLYKHQKIIVGTLWGYLFGRVINELSDKQANIIEIFSLQYSIWNITSWVVFGFFILLYSLNKWVKRDFEKRQYITNLESLTKAKKAAVIARYTGLGWGEMLSLQTCPYLQWGWSIDDFELNHDTTMFVLPEKYQQSYKEYFQTNYERRRFYHDGIKIMLRRNPIAFSDAPKLVLHTQEVKYSQVQFYRDNVSLVAAERDELNRVLIEDLKVDFAHALCLALVVVTLDEKILMVQRSPKVAVNAGTWTCSIDETLVKGDIKGTSKETIKGWVDRALSEELGLDSTSYEEANLRILSAFLEAGHLNISLCVHLTLNINSNELDKVLYAMPRTDYEFTDWQFLNFEQIFKELKSPTKQYDVSAPYRILMALIRHYGMIKFVDLFIPHKSL